MRNLKKFLALVLAMVMAMSLMVSANAATDNKVYPDNTDVKEFQEAVAVLSGMGIFKGDQNGKFNPADGITRAEVAAIIYRLVTADVSDNQANLYRNVNHGFTDVTPDKWYAGYVGYLWNAQIIKGVTATSFNPAGKVTGYEVLAMILRAVGYDKQNEFVGGTWRINVASIAQQKGILIDVNKTNYGEQTFYSPARRDVVASLLFRTAAYVPMVQWTSAFSYQETGMTGGVVGSEKNPTLGEKNFGLAMRSGIVVGNQYTGENKTLLGKEFIAHVKSGVLDSATFSGDSYEYLSSTAANSKPLTPTEGAKGNVTTAYSFKTDLDYFGHKVNVWYDYRTNGADATVDDGTTTLYFTSNFSKTYTVFDKATKVATVFAEDDTLNAAGPNGNTSILTAAKNAGFGDPASQYYTSDQYWRMQPAGSNMGGDFSEVGLFRVISNGGTGINVVISLNQEVGKITQRNSTVSGGEYIYLGTGASQFGDDTSSTIVVNPYSGKGVIFDTAMVPDNDKTLGHIVTATEIYKTSDATKTAVLYQTAELKPAFTGTVSTYILSPNTLSWDSTSRLVTEVTLSSTEVYRLSGITGSNDHWHFDSYMHLIDGSVGALIGAAAGRSYSFYTDEAGRFIGVTSPNEYQFMYVTFADYEIGALGTGTSSYHAYGVNWNGEKVDTAVNSITLPLYDNGDGTYNFAPYSYSAYYTFEDTVNTAPNNSLQRGYNFLPVTQKNQGFNSITGNGIKEGPNTRFAYDGKGVLDGTGSNIDDWGTQFRNTWTDANGNTGTAWVISTTDATNGFARVYNGTIDYLLTNETEFIVVTGSGTADLSVAKYTGLTGLLDGSNGVEIDNSQFDNVYFLTKADQFGNVNVSDNRIITKVIMGNTNLQRYNTSSLYFAEPGNTALAGVTLAGANDPDGSIKQFKLYSNGVVGYYWIETDGVTYANCIDADDTTGYGDFYTLAQINTINGQPIYRATKVTRNGTNDIDLRYNYIVVNNLSTADIGGKVYKVEGAKVAQAFGDNVPVISTNNINTVEKLHNAVSMGLAGSRDNLYDVEVAIVYSGVNVSCIYVTDIQPFGTIFV